jgi:TetR/AcrR family transcriptional regulator, cholesterol catabolism regulator
VSALGGWSEGFEKSLRYVVEELHREVRCRPLLAEAMARAYVVADASVALEVEMVRSQLIDLFADAVSRGTPTESHIDVAALLTDVLAANLLALAHGRAEIGDVRRRLQLIVELLTTRHGGTIGSPDWHRTRSVSEQSAHCFYDWAPRVTGAARSAR